jgi:hypothetical protein
METKNITLEKINKVISLACELNAIQYEWILSGSRRTLITQVKHMCCYYLIQELRIPRERFQHLLGYPEKDHRGFISAGAFHAYKAFEKKMFFDKKLQSMLHDLRVSFAEYDKNIIAFHKGRAKESLKELFPFVPIEEHNIIEKFIHSYLI